MSVETAITPTSGIVTQVVLVSENKASELAGDLIGCANELIEAITPATRIIHNGQIA